MKGIIVGGIARSPPRCSVVAFKKGASSLSWGILHRQASAKVENWFIRLDKQTHSCLLVVQYKPSPKKVSRSARGGLNVYYVLYYNAEATEATTTTTTRERDTGDWLFAYLVRWLSPSPPCFLPPLWESAFVRP